MNPLSAVYGAITWARNNLYDRGIFSVRKLKGPVISIGNVAAGGSGKTPFLITLGTLLKERGVTFDVLSRGYGRATKGVLLVDPEGSPRDYGDEPLLIVRKLRVPVIVGENRYEAGEFAEQRLGPILHLLDDGFQHRRLARDFDIVLVTPTDATDSLLPTGRLRETIRSLSRADAVVLTNDTSSSGLTFGGQDLWRVQRGIVAPGGHGKYFAFCGIARPEGFFAQLRSAGIDLVGTHSFRDHHAYSPSDVRQLQALRQEHGAETFLTTEKDAINLGTSLAALNPAQVVPVVMKLDDADGVVDRLLRTIRERNRQPA